MSVTNTFLFATEHEQSKQCKRYAIHAMILKGRQRLQGGGERAGISSMISNRDDDISSMRADAKVQRVCR